MRSANEVTATLCMDPIFTIILWNIDFIDCIYKHLSIQMQIHVRETERLNARLQL